MQEIFSTTAKLPNLIVVDNFYSNPNKVRKFALTHNFIENNNLYKGVRTKERYASTNTKSIFETLINSTICSDSWNTHQFNGCFQATSAENQQVYHCDQNSWAGVLYLSPNAPVKSGTRTMKSKITGLIDCENTPKDLVDMTFQHGYYDSNPFDVLDDIGNIFNRLVLFKSTQIHSAGPYFGTELSNGRLVQLFFFDTRN